MSKYIIKNCPVCEFSDWEECTGYLAEGYICNDVHTEIVECQNRTDCVMKQIVEKCKNNQKLKWQVGEKPEQWISFNNPSSYQILQLLDIQEVE